MARVRATTRKWLVEDDALHLSFLPYLKSTPSAIEEADLSSLHSLGVAGHQPNLQCKAALTLGTSD